MTTHNNQAKKEGNLTRRYTAESIINGRYVRSPQIRLLRGSRLIKRGESIEYGIYSPSL